MTVPDLRLLAYAERRPNLRVLRLAPLEIGVSPTLLDGAIAALDACHRRDGWIAFEASGGLGAAIPLGSDAFFVAESFDCITGLNGRTVWVQDGSASDGRPSEYVEYDGVVARSVIGSRSPKAPVWKL